jgi:hypothetical protein
MVKEPLVDQVPLPDQRTVKEFFIGRIPMQRVVIIFCKILDATCMVKDPITERLKKVP